MCHHIPQPDLYENDALIDTCCEIVDEYHRISCTDLAKWLTDPNSGVPGILQVLDARHFYEYSGGHIVGARNITTRAQLISLYRKYKDTDCVIVIHCEYSTKRGPCIYNWFINYDSTLNSANYPKRCFPHIYLLTGGYKQFYSQFPEFCLGGYIQETDPRFVNEYRRCNSAFKREMINYRTYEEADHHHQIKRRGDFKSISLSQEPIRDFFFEEQEELKK